MLLLNRDLRTHDHPALAEAAASAEQVVPLFVVDEGLLERGAATANKQRFLAESLADLRKSLRGLGADLVVRRGDPVAWATRIAREVGAGEVVVSDDVSAYARRRWRRLQAACKAERLGVVSTAGPTVVSPGALTPVNSDHYRVFTPYWKVWRRATWREVVAAPASLRLPRGLEPGSLPLRGAPPGTTRSPGAAEGGETAARSRAANWVESLLGGYDERRDDLAGDATSRLSPYLHFGCLSALELARSVVQRPASEGFLRQLCWRDFHHQVLGAFPGLATIDYRPRGRLWIEDPEALAAWTAGQTGYPIVDAGMRQLLAEGWMHNRARLIVAAFLTRYLRIDWRSGAAHFMAWLVDADTANNYGNWQWVAGTGNDTRPNRPFNLLRQAERFDPHGEYVRRYVPELHDISPPLVHQPWRIPASQRESLAYPDPLPVAEGMGGKAGSGTRDARPGRRR